MARSSGDAVEREALYTEAQEIIAAEQTSVWMYIEDSGLARNTCVKGYRYSPMYQVTVLFQDLWMDGC